MTHSLKFLVAPLLIAAAGCSFSIGGDSPEKTAESLIDGELADLIGLGGLEAACDEAADSEVGTEFSCTGTTADGRVIEFVTVIDREDRIDVNTTNLMAADVVAQLEIDGAEALGRQVGVQLPADSIDCPEGHAIFEDALNLLCTFYAPGSSDVYDITFELPDLVSGDFSLQVADNPR